MLFARLFGTVHQISGQFIEHGSGDSISRCFGSLRTVVINGRLMVVIIWEERAFFASSAASGLSEEPPDLSPD